MKSEYKDEVSVKKYKNIPFAIIALVEAMKKKINEPCLAKILSEGNQEMDAKNLWQKSRAFYRRLYATLKREIDEGFIVEPEAAKLKL